ncbi:Serine hydrolase FSH [Dillenia turbinata]|uniref:Serine hydrolase FSH n=1 Tax=Dillenia turbinata TaxID=194707 RepID=A0AAN8W2J8_9MAGN
MEGREEKKRMKILCLHGFRTSGSFFKKQISKWDPIFASFDMDFPNGLFPAGGKSELEGFFPPPYYEWFQFDKDFTEYTNLEECIAYLCDYITNNGPFDGFLGFSQGATLSALLLGYQAQFRDPSICQIAYEKPIKVKSVHFIGDKDWLKLPSEELATAFDNPLVIRHPQGHVVPRLDVVAVEKLRNWTREILESTSDLLNHECGQVKQQKEAEDMAEEEAKKSAAESTQSVEGQVVEQVLA